MGPQSAAGASRTDMLTTLLGGTAKGIGQVLGGRAAAKQHLFSAAVLRQNAQIANLGAEQTLKAGKISAQKKLVDTAMVLGEQQASFAGRGVAVGQDTAAEIAANTRAFGRLDAETLAANAEHEALLLRLRGANFEMQARGEESAAKSANIAGAIEGATTFLNTGTRVSAKWSAHKKLVEGKASVAAQVRRRNDIDEAEELDLLGR